MNTSSESKPDKWTLRQPYSWKLLLVFLLVSAGLGVSAKRTDVARGFHLTLEALAYAVGLTDKAEVAVGWRNFMERAFPLVLSERTATSRLQDFDRNRLPPLSYLVQEPTLEYDLARGDWVETEQQEYLVEPLGYLTHVLWKMLETLEMAMWGTLLSIVLSIPLAYFGAAGFSWNSATYTSARALCSFCRALPELIIAIFFVLLFGFGTLPGILALGVHCCGFLGKFFADDIENADRGPQEALECTGANRLKVLWYAVLPQTMPQFIAYIQYILERNVRTATVLGIVGAGGIGLELKGRLDLSDYAHVSTILLVIFITVFSLEQISQRLRLTFIAG